MGQIHLTRPNCETLLQDAGTEPGMRAVAALGIAFFELNDHADKLDGTHRGICLKLIYMCQEVIHTAERDAYEDEEDDDADA
ncbi:hypothetical protein D7Y32_01720 [Stenotrophomonas maltophilia]|uniref:Uncharacterized protein n=1 Tax=Stenotrophomonas maltophilia TaxID=40324 RepID=A0A2W6ISX8_STEMA|nr:hypothetical protein [Stenotrophomonas maltophilia]MBA0258669.1 hypothetical protein [Stenotrophomonas maltophilia]MBH1668031.1 hypothetical protein [Stenotrophomonas maltophilia]MBN5153275.1 hypothetical protein [Stenotrophomonas maltophilia]PZS86965.1 hypothetical protein A7X83_18335 [Stenotrophomonas maltophilia]